MSIKLRKSLYHVYGCFGFFGFTFLRFFSSHDIMDLCGIAFFAFFGNFLLAGIYTDKPDERFYENVRNAKAFTATIALAQISILFATLILFIKDLKYITLMLAFCLATSILAYSFRLYYLEKMD